MKVWSFVICWLVALPLSAKVVDLVRDGGASAGESLGSLDTFERGGRELVRASDLAGITGATQYWRGEALG